MLEEWWSLFCLRSEWIHESKLTRRK